MSFLRGGPKNGSARSPLGPFSHGHPVRLIEVEVGDCSGDPAGSPRGPGCRRCNH